MKRIKSFVTKLWKDESGQGTAEYVLLIAVVVALAVMFRDRIKGLVEGRLEAIGGKMETFNGE